MSSEGTAGDFLELEVTRVLMLGRCAWLSTEFLTLLT